MAYIDRCGNRCCRGSAFCIELLPAAHKGGLDGDPMSHTLPVDGGADQATKDFIAGLWVKLAIESRKNLDDFPADGPLEDRLAWAKGRGLSIACAYSRYSTKHQDSTQDQYRAIIEFAVRKGIYVPPEFACVDEGRTGRKKNRRGLNRLKSLLVHPSIGVLIVFRLSRLFRLQHAAIAFFREEVFERGIRGIAVAQHIDTAEGKQWKLMLAISGIIDEQLVDATSDHVRQAKIGVFEKGWNVGPLPIGYRPAEIVGAPQTKKGKPRTRPEIDPDAAAMVLRHFQMIADGLPIAEGVRRWNIEGGPLDPRSSTQMMTYAPYVRMLKRVQYTGNWFIGRTRVVWSSSRDGVRQIPNNSEDVRVIQYDHLRIVSDELFQTVQERLLRQKCGRRERRRDRSKARLWDRVNHLFVCGKCDSRMHVYGSKCQYLKCLRPLCPVKGMVNKRDAVDAILECLSVHVLNDAELVNEVVKAASEMPPEDADRISADVAAARRSVSALARRIEDLEALLGVGNDDDRARRRDQIMAAQSERSVHQLRIKALDRHHRNDQSRVPALTHESIRAALSSLGATIEKALASAEDEAAVERAADLITRLVGGRVIVDGEQRPARKRWMFFGRFTPRLLNVLVTSGAIDATCIPAGFDSGVPEQCVALRPTPRIDKIADEVREMYEVQKLGFAKIAKLLQAKLGVFVGSGNASLAYRRSYEMRGLPAPDARPGGRPRKGAA